jgi:hypothetical protein
MKEAANWGGLGSTVPTSSDERIFQMMWPPTEAIPIVAAFVFVDRAIASWIDAC